MSVSQSRITVHPSRRSIRVFRRSRAMLASIFASQYCAFVPLASRSRRRSQLRPCQKSPSQNTTTRALRNTMSGFPGRSVACSRYRAPERHNCFRRISSARVFRDRFPRFAREAASDAGLKPEYRGTFAIRTSVHRSRAQVAHGGRFRLAHPAHSWCC